MTDVTIVLEGGYPYATGGVSEWTRQLVAGLPHVEFCVAHLGAPGAEAVYELPANVRVVALDPDSRPEELPEASVYHALSSGAPGSLAARAAAERGRRLVLSEHGLAWLEARLGIVGCQQGPNGYAPRSDAARVAVQAREAYAGAHAVTSVCAWNTRLQRALGAERVRVIENPAHPRATALPEDRDPGSPLVGFVGRVVRVKDVVTFLRACRLVAEALPRARFAVVGPHHDPEYAYRCRALADELRLDVTFTGETDPTPWYAQLDALVLTSRSEAQPLVVLEAMAAEVPVVATDVGGCGELLAGRGLVTRPGDPRATAHSVLRLLADEPLRRRLVAAASERVERRHDPARVFAAFGELYEVAAA